MAAQLRCGPDGGGKRLAGLRIYRGHVATGLVNHSVNRRAGEVFIVFTSMMQNCEGETLE